MPKNRQSALNCLGFSLLELLIVVVVVLVVASIAVPSLQSTMAAYRGSSAIDGIASQLSLSKMRAAAQFTRTRLSLDTTNNAYRRELYNKPSSSFQAEGGDQPLARGVSFGFGGIVTPAGGQSTIQQSTEIIFNSRGIPVNSGGVPVGSYAVYVNNDGRYYAVTVNTAGQIRRWRYSGSAWVTE